MGRIVAVDELERGVEVRPESRRSPITLVLEGNDLERTVIAVVVAPGAVCLEHGVHVPAELVKALHGEGLGQVEDHGIVRNPHAA